VFYNAAIDLKNGKSPAKGKTPIKGKDSKALSSDVNAARKAAAERRAEEKAAAAQKLAAENRERKKRLAEARSKGKNDVVGLYKFKAVDP
jgi:transposase